jgi:glycosyltransferase involved in cell wall biosynthesis
LRAVTRSSARSSIDAWRQVKYLRLTRATLAASRRFKPDVVYAHFLVPTGLIGALAGRAPLVVTAHGRDVRNVGWLPGIGTATRFVARRAAAIIAVSDYLRRELEAKVPEARGKTEVVDSGVDLDRFMVQPAPPTGPPPLCIGSPSSARTPVSRPHSNGSAKDADVRRREGAGAARRQAGDRAHGRASV